MNIFDEKYYKKVSDDEMNYVKEKLKSKNENSLHYIDPILENIYNKTIKEQQINFSNTKDDKNTYYKKESDKKYIYDKNTDIRNYEDHISKKKKRAFTLGAIDGIGGISILNAPLINPENARIDPPILQLPSATNLIKNVHVRVNFDKNIDKSYKYRTQNSNKDIMKNMKPLYSLPEKVMTYYMYDNSKGEKKWESTKNRCNNLDRQKWKHKVDNLKDVVKDESEGRTADGEKQEGKMEEEEDKMGEGKSKAIGEAEVEAVLVLEDRLRNKEKKIPSRNEESICALKDKTGNMFSEEKKIKSCEIPNNSSNNSVYIKENNAPFSKTSLVKKVYQNKQFNNVNSNYKEGSPFSENVVTLQNNNNYDEQLDINNDQLKIFEANKIMSSTLINALKVLAHDVSF
ncbi:conserved Plasmodium protein, unknown function [Plasmodium malariae]|uniref:Uncharacterized protein n=1 Tax=Plasmodium malariae TaxID=5858 RepID=A0A1C3KZM7_PLAMA|nr:conserved Plasmodium protein, unknown function [Plasmodium malariae]